MSSSGSAADISGQEAMDLLHKLVTESTSVMATFSGIAKLSSGTFGVVRVCPDGTILVAKPDFGPRDSFLRFDPTAATSFRYGDHRSLLPTPKPEYPNFSSAIAFIYPDKTFVMLYELGADS